MQPSKNLPKEPLGHTVVRWLARLQKIAIGPVSYVETGTTRERHPNVGDVFDARSTIAVAQWLEVAGMGGRAHTIDLHQPHLDLCKDALAEIRMDHLFEYHQGDGAECLHKLAETMRFDFVLLDSDSNPGQTFREYQAIVDHMNSPGFILIDDIHRNGINKGGDVMAHREARRLPMKLVAHHVLAIPFGAAARQILEEA